MADLPTVLEMLFDAIRAYSYAVRYGGDVVGAIRVYNDAENAYYELLAEHDAGAPWDVVVVDPQEDDDEPDWALPEGTRIAVRARADFVVTDEAAVLAAGTAARGEAWAGERTDEVRHVGEALYELVHNAGPIMPMLRVPGLVPAGALLVVHRTGTEVASEDDFAVGADEEQLYGLSEEWG